MTIQNNLCKCPYCFNKFLPHAAAFRAETVYAEQDLEELSPEEAAEKRKFLESEDPVYVQFWNRYPGSRPEDPYAKRAVIWNLHREVKDERMQYLEGEYRKDSEGFINEAVDSMGTVSKIRICPHCHNRLPFEFGKHPVIYISIVGITSSGKTVYLSQFLKQIKEIMARADLTVVGTCREVEEFVNNHKIEKGKPLPAGNTTHILTLPLPLNVISNADNRRYTIIFYDIAGENCVKPEQMEKYGPFIENANGIIMVVDPGQFSELFHLGICRQDDSDTVRPEKVIEAMYNTFVASDGIGGKSNIPLAVTLSKSDLLKDCLANGQDMNIFYNIDYRKYEGHGFPYDDFINVNTEMKRLIKGDGSSVQGEIFLNTVNQNFARNAFFAFSALNVSAVTMRGSDNKDYSYIEEDPETIRVEEPIFWILHELQIIREVRKTRDSHANNRLRR